MKATPFTAAEMETGRKVLRHMSEATFKSGLIKSGGGLLLAAVNFGLLFLISTFIIIYVGAPDTTKAEAQYGGLIIAMIGTIIAFATYSLTNHRQSGELELRYGIWNTMVDDEGIEFAVQIILWVLYIAPMLIYDGLRELIAATRLRGPSTTDCAVVIGLLYLAEGKVPYEHLCDRLGNKRLDAVVKQLKNLDGVMLLQADPPGMALADRVRPGISAGLEAQAAD